MMRSVSRMDKLCVVFVLFLGQYLHIGNSESRKDGHRGPTFRSEPPARVEFSNTAGTELVCSAEGYPPPKVFWAVREGITAADVPGLRYQRNTGDGSTLVFPPFSRSEYKQPVHDAVYQCVASNSIGTILGRHIHVRGVVKQRFTPQVYDEFVTRGNTAVLRCHLPSFVKEYVVVDAWLRSDGQVFKAADEVGRGKIYSVLNSGELLIYEVKERDSGYSYRCQTRHKLTGEMVTSETSAKITVSEPHVSTLARITFSRSQVRAEEGSTAQLPCVAEGNPPPSYRWMKDISGMLRQIDDKSRILMSHGVLEFKRVAKTDGGVYQCIARNSIGEKRVETSLIVTAPLEVHLRPQQLELNVGQEATFSCNVTGYPVHQVFWIKDRKPLSDTSSSSRTRFLSRDVLHISSVRREDKGMYQCFAHNDQDSAQGSAQLLIADAPPSLITVFPENTVHPGDKVSMKCMAMGNPIPKIVWFLDGEQVHESGRVVSEHNVVEPNGHLIGYLNITEVRSEDSGEYECQVTNEVGSASHSSRLNVHGPPFVRPLRNKTAISGSELVLKCPYGGYPIRRVRWLKGDMMLPFDPRQRITHSGAMSIQKVQRSSDEGQYTCEVKNSIGESASGSAFVSVVVAPKINSVLLPDTLTMDEDSRTKLVCVVSSGDTPLRFQWLKDGQPYLAHGDATVHTYEDSSIITLKKVTAADNGRYTCVATNSAASANRTLNLVVNVPPQWTVQPSNATVILRGSVWMDCAAVGFPPPTILWKKLIYTTDSNAGDFTWVQSSPRAHRFNNGTLTLTEVDENDAGSYLCQAQNGIGAGLSKVIILRVLIPPRIVDTYQNLIAIEGNNITLRCLANGDLPIDITWHKNYTLISDYHRYVINSMSDGSQSESELHIVNSSRQDDTDKFICKASSDIGEDKAQRQLTVQGRPSEPMNIRIMNITSRTLSFQWDILHDGNSHITSSLVQYKYEAERSWTGNHASELIVSGSDTDATLRSLSPVTTYFIRIVAENALGRSQSSEIINATTLEEAPADPPTEIQVHSTGAQSMKVTWKAPPEESRNGKIRGYFVGYRTTTSSDPYHYQKVETKDDHEQYSTYITGLKPFTQYDIVVKAFNSVGSSPKSPKVVQKTLETAPPTSPIAQVTSSSSSSIDVHWEKEAKEKSAITDYTLHFKADGESEWQEHRISGKDNKFSLKGLKCGTRYSIYITASNSLGTGEPSLPIVAQTKGIAPKSPRIEIFVSPNSTWVMLHLDQWQSMGCPIKRFIIKYRFEHQSRWTYSEEVPGPRDKYIIKHLTFSTDYVVHVAAFNDAGSSEGEYHFRTKAVQSDSSYTAYGKQETDQPFYRNASLVIPVVVSSLVLVILAFAVAICFRKNSNDRHRERDCVSHKSCNDALVMTDIGKDGAAVKPSTKSSHYSVPGRNPEYAEPYSYNNPNREQNSDGGLFATIKRCPTRPAYTPTSYKQGIEPQCHGGQVSTSLSHSDAGTSAEAWSKSCRKSPG